MKKSFSFGVLGSSCLFLGLLLTLLKYAHSLWPIVAAAIAGCALIAIWKKGGLICSVVLLACALSTQLFFWPILLSSCIAISWLILYLEQEQRMLSLQEKESLLASLQSDIERLKAISFQGTLQRAQLESELRMQKMVKPEEKKEDPDELKSLQALQVQHAQLREQFEEKSEVLHQTRKELFALESAYLTLKNEIAERACTSLEEHSALIQYLEKLQQEEEQVLVLEEILSAVLAEKKPSVPRKRKTKKELDLFLLAPRQTI